MKNFKNVKNNLKIQKNRKTLRKFRKKSLKISEKLLAHPKIMIILYITKHATIAKSNTNITKLFVSKPKFMLQ
jgi:hypothetical protein